MRADSSEHGRRLTTADEDDAPARRDLGHRLPQDVVEEAIARRVLIVVEDEREGRLQAAAQLTKIATGEDAEAVAVLGRQEGQGPAAPWRRSAQIVEEGRHVGVDRIDLIPDAAQAASRQVAGDEGGLAGPGRPVDPGHRAATRLVEDTEQPDSLAHPAHARGARLGEAHTFTSTSESVLTERNSSS